MINQGLIESALRASIIAVFPFGLWLWLGFGPRKAWYFQTSTTSIIFGVARFWYYVAPFLALAFLLAGIDDFLIGQNPHTLPITFFISIGCIVLGFVCGFLQPDWLSPPWLRRLRREYGKDVINLLIEDAVGMEKNELEQRLKTWEDIEAWIVEVQSSH